MMRLLSLSLIVLALAVSCAEKSTPVPQTALPSPTMQVVIVAPTNALMLTLTPKSTSTLAPSLASTPTPAPTLTPTSSPTPAPELPILFSWSGLVNLKAKPQYAWEAGVWNNPHETGGKLEIVNDEVFGPKSMFKSTVTDNSNPPIRVYMDKAGPAQKPSENGFCAVSITIEGSPDYMKPPKDGFINFLSVFSEAGVNKTNAFHGVGSILIDYTGASTGIPSIYTNAAGKDFPPYDRGMFHKPLEPNTRYRMTLKFGKQGPLIGEISVFNSDTKSFDLFDTTVATIDPVESHQVTLVHGGAYARGVPNGSWIKHSGIEVVCR
jgi:hypothetical protein